jgi:hypothetical protein
MSEPFIELTTGGHGEPISHHAVPISQIAVVSSYEPRIGIGIKAKITLRVNGSVLVTLEDYDYVIRKIREAEAADA